MDLMEKLVKDHIEIAEQKEEKEEVVEKEEGEEVEEKEDVVITDDQEEGEEKEEGEEEIEIKEEEEINIVINEFDKKDFEDLEKEGFTVDDKFEAYAKELIDDGFTPEQIKKLARRTMKENPSKKDLTPKEASDLLNEKLSKAAKKNYHENVKTVTEAFKEHPVYGKHIKKLTRDPQFMEMVNDLRKVFVPNGEVAHTDIRLKEKTGKVLTALTVDQAIDQYMDVQYKVTTKQEMAKAREDFAKRVPKDRRQDFLDTTDLFDPRKLKK